MSHRSVLNTLQVKNVDHVIWTFHDRQVDIYKGPFQILAELEEIVSFQEAPKDIIFIEYKDGGDAIFDFVETKPGKNLDTHVYKFRTTIS